MYRYWLKNYYPSTLRMCFPPTYIVLLLNEYLGASVVTILAKIVLTKLRRTKGGNDPMCKAWLLQIYAGIPTWLCSIHMNRGVVARSRTCLSFLFCPSAC